MSDYLLFASAFFASAIAPGADTFLILSRALVSRSSAILSVLGIIAGKALMISLVYMGLSALLQSASEILFALQVIGAGYLIWRSYKLWNSELSSSRETQSGDFWSAFVIAFGNPQPFAFYLAVIPVIVSDTLLAPLLLIVVVGFAAVGATYVLLASAVQGWLLEKSNYRLINRAMSIVFLTLAVIILTR